MVLLADELGLALGLAEALALAEPLGDAVALDDALGDELALAAGTILAEVFAVLVELADGVAFAEEVPEADDDALGDADVLAEGVAAGVVVLVAP